MTPAIAIIPIIAEILKSLYIKYVIIIACSGLIHR